MRLSILDGKFIKFSLLPADEYWPDGRPSFKEDVSMSEADGLMFLCPKCYASNNGSIGTHSVICWFKGKVPDWIDPKPGRWNPSGTNLEDITFVPPGAVSVLLTSGCGWHGFVSNGDAS